MPPEQRPPLSEPSTLIATFFGAGYAPKAPGTVGSLAAALPIWLYLSWLANLSYVNFILLPAAALGITYAAGVWATDRFAARVDRHDPGAVVIDEVAGMLTATLVSQLLAVWLFPVGLAFATAASLARGGPAMLLAPRFGFESAWQQILLLFGLFRLFDILKPWPIGRIDRELDNAHGVMLDDVVAGVFAGLAWAVVVYGLADKIPLGG